MIWKIILGILSIYILAAIYFGVIKKMRLFKFIKKTFKILIFAVLIGIALILLFPTLRG